MGRRGLGAGAGHARAHVRGQRRARIAVVKSRCRGRVLRRGTLAGAHVPRQSELSVRVRGRVQSRRGPGRGQRQVRGGIVGRRRTGTALQRNGHAGRAGRLVVRGRRTLQTRTRRAGDAAWRRRHGVGRTARRTGRRYRHVGAAACATAAAAPRSAAAHGSYGDLAAARGFLLVVVVLRLHLLPLYLLMGPNSFY